jgi:glycine/D-amino acid oxidase-like deaminating enzyme
MVESPNTPSGQPVAWIFGAGITGLTAAHELIERGFEVYVVEPADDPWEPDLPAVGGVARTQWAMIPPAPADGVEGLTETVPMLRHPVLDFEGELGAAALGPDHRWELDAFARKLRAVYGDALPTVRLQVCGAHQTTARHLAAALDALLAALTEYTAARGVSARPRRHPGRARTRHPAHPRGARARRPRRGARRARLSVLPGILPAPV